MKKCNKCGIEKELSEFNKNKNTKTGINYSCRECTKKDSKNYHNKHREKELQRTKNYHYNNRDKNLLRAKIYHINNKEQRCITSKEYSEKLSLYEPFKNKLTIDEEPRLSEDGISLEVRCYHCKQYFIPMNKMVIHRISAINGKLSGESHIYCSQECKDSCIIYRQQEYLKEPQELPYTQHELNIWAEAVKSKYNYICEMCGAPATDAHHIKPKKLFPNEALDIDNGAAYCRSCHMTYGHAGECSTGKLASVVCTYNHSSTNSSIDSTSSTNIFTINLSIINLEQ